MTVGYHCRSWILCIYCFRVTLTIVSQCCSSNHDRVPIQRSRIDSPKFFFCKKNNGRETQNASFYFRGLECSDCRLVDDSGLGRRFYLGSAEISSVVCTWLNSRMEDAEWFVCIASAKSRSARRASHQLAFMDSCLTVSYMCLPCLPSRWSNPEMFCTTPSHSGASGGCFDVFQEQNYVALLPGNEISAGFHYRNWILGI